MNKKKNSIGKTAATANYLIERVTAKRVALCEQQGGQWVTVERSISRAAADRYGISQGGVPDVFEGIK